MTIANHPLSPLQAVAQPVQFPANGHLFFEGDMAKGFWLVQSGLVKIYSLGENMRQVEIHRSEPGDIVGAALCFANTPFPHFGLALEPVQALYYPLQKARPIITQHPALADLFLKILSGKCNELISRITTLQMQSVRERLLHYLGEVCPKNSACSFTLPLSKKDLASQIGTGPETLSRCFQSLQDEGILTFKNRHITLHGCIRKERCVQ
jgi:CRP-like cAMP-binding protein